MTPENRLAELKLELPPAPKPVGVYKPVVTIGNLAYVSGHGPLKADRTLILGRVGADMDVAAGKLAARQVGLAILEPLRELDEVAYLRFASVYRSFESLADFEAEITALRTTRSGPAEVLQPVS